MKTKHALALFVALALTACVTVETTAPDGTKTKETRPDAATVQAAAKVAGKAIDRRSIHPDK